MTAVKLFRNRRGERTFRRLDEGNAIRLQETVDDLIIIGFSGVFDSDVIINGDLTVNGTTTTINSTTHVIADNKIVINDGEIGAGVVTLGTKAGLTVDRGSLTDVEWCWDETRDIWTTFGELLGDVADPTLGIHVGDRDFNDARYLQDVVDDTTPQLGGNLDINGWDITDGTNFKWDTANARLSVGTDENTVTVNGVVRGVGINTQSGGGNLANFGSHRHSNNAIVSPFFVGGRTRGTNASPLIVQNNDDLYNFIFTGWDGTDFAQAAIIAVEVDGAPGTDDMPGRIIFSTSADGSQVPTEALRIDSSQDATFAGNVEVDQLTLTDHGANGQMWTIEEDSSGSNTNAITFDYNSVERLRITTDGKVDGRDLAVDGTKLDTIETNAKDDQDLWLTVAGDSGATAANNSTDTLTIAGTGLISTSMSGDTLTISTTATAGGLDNIVEDLTPQLGANLDVNFFDLTEDGNVILGFTGSENAVNWVDIKNADTGLGVVIRSVGSDTNVDLNIEAKGSGIVNLGSGGVKLNANLDVNGNSFIRSGNVVLSFSAPSEFAVNWIDVENADTGLGPTLRVKGSDTNVDLNIEAKGLGRVNITNDSAVAGAFVNDALDTLDVAVTTISGLHYLGAFAVAGLPSEAANTNRLALATNASGGRTLVISDGTNWKVFATEGATVTV